MAIYFLFIIFAVFQHQKEWGIEEKTEKEKSKEIMNIYLSNHNPFHPAGVDMKISVYSFDNSKIHSHKE
ncbi:MAG: hypothetical protein ACOC2E_00895 [Bacteroidota bacterium]